MRYEAIADKKIVEMSGEEREYLSHLMDYPTEDYQRLVVALYNDGCEFPKQQAALMLRNTPGAARHLLDNPPHSDSPPAT